MAPRIAVVILALSSLLAGESAADTSGSDRGQWKTGIDAEVDYGIGLRGRYVTIPRGVFEIFVDEASSGVSQLGGGLEFIRRRGGFELIVGVEYDRLGPEDGLWLDRGDTPPQETPDLVEFEDFGWITLDVAAVWHEPIHDQFAVRYGAGFGLGVPTGELLRTDTQCTGSETSTCSPIAGPDEGRYREAEDLPPVVPVVNALIGVQYRPADWLSLNVEGGIRSVIYAGTSVSAFF